MVTTSGRRYQASDARISVVAPGLVEHDGCRREALASKLLVEQACPDDERSGLVVRAPPPIAARPRRAPLLVQLGSAACPRRGSARA
jgi:hypothetical protein